jgi:hypothetical protein
MHSLLQTLFEKYSQLLKERFSEDFQEVDNNYMIEQDGLLTLFEDCLKRRLYANAY